MLAATKRLEDIFSGYVAGSNLCCSKLTRQVARTFYLEERRMWSQYGGRLSTGEQ